MIKWVKKECILRNFLSQPMIDDVNDLILYFDCISFHRVYRERNQVAIDLSKGGIQLAQVEWIIQNHVQGKFSKYNHTPFNQCIGGSNPSWVWL